LLQKSAINIALMAASFFLERLVVLPFEGPGAFTNCIRLAWLCGTRMCDWWWSSDQLCKPT
jgi:hypothetical protein